MAVSQPISHSTTSANTPVAPEAPSGKVAADENFPVGSWLLPARLRPCIAAFYAFARAADDIADSPALRPDEKLARLNAFGEALQGAPGYGEGYAKAHALREALAAAGQPPKHALDLLAAFSQDATKSRYESWVELMAYCALSANPVGRFLLDLHGEDPTGYAQSDALCSALQILNHLQDCAEDHGDLDRVYIPTDLLTGAGISVDALCEANLRTELRSVIDVMLDGVDKLMMEAHTLPRHLKSRRLAMESSIIIHLANRLSARLRRGDPLAARVALSKWDFVAAGLLGALKGALSSGRGVS